MLHTKYFFLFFSFFFFSQLFVLFACTSLYLRAISEGARVFHGTIPRTNGKKRKKRLSPSHDPFKVSPKGSWLFIKIILLVYLNKVILTLKNNNSENLLISRSIILSFSSWFIISHVKLSFKNHIFNHYLLKLSLYTIKKIVMYSNKLLFVIQSKSKWVPIEIEWISNMRNAN